MSSFKLSLAFFQTENRTVHANRKCSILTRVFLLGTDLPHGIHPPPGLPDWRAAKLVFPLDETAARINMDSDYQVAANSTKTVLRAARRAARRTAAECTDGRVRHNILYSLPTYLRPSESRSASAGTRTILPCTSQPDARLLHVAAVPPPSHGSSSRLLNRSRKASTSVRRRSLTSTGGAGFRSPLLSSSTSISNSVLAGCAASMGWSDSVAFEARQLASYSLPKTSHQARVLSRAAKLVRGEAAGRVPPKLTLLLPPP